MKSEAKEPPTLADLFSRCILKKLSPEEGTRLFLEEVVLRYNAHPVITEESRRSVLRTFREVSRGETPMMSGEDEVIVALKMSRGW